MSECAIFQRSLTDATGQGSGVTDWHVELDSALLPVVNLLQPLDAKLLIMTGL